jgi:hypothetical protein
MDNLEILRTGFIAFLDGLWWGLRDQTGALSMYEGYSGGFKELGKEIAQHSNDKGPEAAARITIDIFTAIGMESELNGNQVIVKSCPIWNRILKKGLEYSFHVETICWKPMLEGIGEVLNATPIVDNSLRIAYIAKSKADYKKMKAKGQLDLGNISQGDYDKLIKEVDTTLEKQPKFGVYGFK